MAGITIILRENKREDVTGKNGGTENLPPYCRSSSSWSGRTKRMHGIHGYTESSCVEWSVSGGTSSGCRQAFNWDSGPTDATAGARPTSDAGNKVLLQSTRRLAASLPSNGGQNMTVDNGWSRVITLCCLCAGCVIVVVVVFVVAAAVVVVVVFVAMRASFSVAAAARLCYCSCFTSTASIARRRRFPSEDPVAPKMCVTAALIDRAECVRARIAS